MTYIYNIYIYMYSFTNVFSARRPKLLIGRRTVTESPKYIRTCVCVCVCTNGAGYMIYTSCTVSV